MQQELELNGAKISRTVRQDSYGNGIVKINNLWLQVEGDKITNRYITHGKELYVNSYPSNLDIRMLEKKFNIKLVACQNNMK